MTPNRCVLVGLPLLLLTCSAPPRVAAATADLEIQHFEISQGLQNRANSIPLVLGKPTVVRVFPRVVRGDVCCVDGVSAELHAFRGGQELRGSPIRPDNGPITADEGKLDRGDNGRSLNFTLAADWFTRDTELTAVLVLPGGVKDPNPANNRFPATGAFKAKYHRRKGLSIQYALVHYTNKKWKGADRPTGRVTHQAACDYLRSLYPADPTTISYSPLPQREITFEEGDAKGHLNGDSLITELNTLVGASPSPPDRLYAWVPGNSYPPNGISDPLWADGLGRVALGADTDHRWRRTFAHEIAHNTDADGLQHVTRRLTGDQFGYDVLNVDPFQRKVMRLYPPEDRAGQKDLLDFMAPNEIEAHAWITPEHYSALYRSLRLPTADSDGPRADDDGTDFLVVRGSVTRTGEGMFYPFYTIPANKGAAQLAARPRRNGPYAVRFFRGDKEDEGLRITWATTFSTSKPGGPKEEELASRPFTFFIPARKVAGVSRVELAVNGRAVATLHVPKGRPNLTGVQKTELSGATDDPHDKVMKLRWKAAPGADSSTAQLVHQVYWSNDDGKTWRLVASGLKKPEATIPLRGLAGGAKCKFQIRTSDGFNASTVTTDAFPLEAKPSKVNIIAPPSGTKFKEGAGVLLMGQGYTQHGRTVSPSNLRWVSDRQGVLGSGPKIVVRDLQPGTHTIQLMAPGQPGKPVDSVKLIISERGK